MKRQLEVELLQRYRRDRRELLRFILSAGIIEKIVTQPGTVSLDDVDFDKLSVDYVVECAKKGGTLDLSEAVKKYYDELNNPLMIDSELGRSYLLVSNPESSGPPPRRSPPPVLVSSSTRLTKNHPKSYPLYSTPSQQSSVEEEIDDFEGGEEDDESMSEYVPRRQLNDANELHLELPPFKSGLSNDDLRETAYEVLLASIGDAFGLVMANKENKKEKKSKFMRKLTGSKNGKHKPQPQQTSEFVGLLNTIRVQMEISESIDMQTREGLLSAAAGTVSKRMDTLLIPLELLCSISAAEFSDRRFYLRWQKRQLKILEEGLINHPAFGLKATESMATEFRALLLKIEEAEGLPSQVGSAQRAEALRVLRRITIQAGGRPAKVDISGEVCHWADGYHLNIQLYEKLLCSVFDTLEEGRLLEEVNEILELLKLTWRILGITQTMHDACYTWVLFRQFVMTGESSLLQHAILQMKKISSHGQRSAQECTYMQSLCCSVENDDAHREQTFVESLLSPIKKWCDKRLRDFHLMSSKESSNFEGILTAAMLSGRLIADECDHHEVSRMTSAAEMALAAKQIEDYIISSTDAAYERALATSNAKYGTVHEHPLRTLAEAVKNIAQRISTVFSPVLSRWNPQSSAISASLLHSLYGRELKPFLDGVSHLSEDVKAVFPAADILEQYLIELVYSVNEEDEVNGCYMQGMAPYQVEAISAPLLTRWVNIQLGRIVEWVERAIQQERWDPLSAQLRHGASVVEVFRIVEETTEQFFNFNLPMRFSQLKVLANGFDNTFQLYCKNVINQLVDKGDLLPPTPILTRHKKDSAVNAFTKKKVSDTRERDEGRVSEITDLSTSKLCVRLNSLNYMLKQLDLLEDNIKDRWVQARPRRRSIDDDIRCSSDKLMDGFSSMFDETRKVVDAATRKICDFTGVKIIFWDMREKFIDNLYRGSVSQARIESVIQVLDSVLGQLCDVIASPLRDQVVIGLLQASLDGYVRVLLDGGPSRVFSQDDRRLLAEDLQILKDFFMAGGDGLPKNVVENAFAPVEQIVKLYGLKTEVIIESLMHESEHNSIGDDPKRYGSRSSRDADTLLRVLCHRSDKEASKFLKKQYRLPKSAAYDDTPGKESSPMSPFTGASMTDLLKRSASIRWGTDGQRSFRMLKQRLQEATIEFRQGGW
ncbi:hypothetical protein SUGI_1201130 [Cryptomeria japonica]|uniref:protein unc-13 homolog n=1 Tax=Cryptomeria japonica TaxID=3369 RepID=UPI0024147F40|nr:protein unc-13 homolog [Cryptomeria japonica]XP_057858076.2 protein unc-13 homolog [Cryptomeria japonica]XP_057858077.2 protein unc-13 homolog [Cryptomeria japonica]GLJ55952.1 hypothetical protein SUGI_1201130 [Cryptomeria japonica]